MPREVCRGWEVEHHVGMAAGMRAAGMGAVEEVGGIGGCEHLPGRRVVQVGDE